MLFFFSTIGVHNYWSSTSLPNQTTKAWYWNTQFGITTYDTKTNTNYVICVKGNPSTLALNAIDSKSKIKVYPNPFSSKINIDFATGNEIYELYNATGQQIFIGKNIDKQDFSNIAKGTYLLKIVGETTSKHKLIKQ